MISSRKLCPLVMKQFEDGKSGMQRLHLLHPSPGSRLKNSNLRGTIMSLRQDSLFVFRLRQCLLMCDWAQVSGGERKRVGRRAARGRVRKDESNALQQRTVTDWAFILAETAPVAGQPRRQQWDQRCSQATAAGEEGKRKRWKHEGARHTFCFRTLPGILFWLFQLGLAADHFFFSPLSDSPSSPINRGLNRKVKRGANDDKRRSHHRSDVSGSRGLKRRREQSVHISGVVLWELPGFVSQLNLSPQREEPEPLRLTSALRTVRSTWFLFLVGNDVWGKNRYKSLMCKIRSAWSETSEEEKSKDTVGQLISLWILLYERIPWSRIWRRLVSSESSKLLLRVFCG